jgi:eukaryotic-like serine/threonine-protein kinase
VVDPAPPGDTDPTSDLTAPGWSDVARGVEYRGDDLERDVARARARQGLLPDVEEPIRIGRYVVLRRVGEGGMGVVYAAYDPELDRSVALKLLRPASGADPVGRERRLLREGRALAKLSHPNVVGVYDVGTYTRERGREVEATTSRQLVFIAMELVDGATFGRWVEDEAPPWRTRLELMLQAGRGLAAAHAAGLVHRDFKPDNVMVGRDGRVRVMDFGLVYPHAIEVSSSPEVRQDNGPTKLDPPMTARGAIIGTPAYMAPEQLLGLPADARSDQFGFCVTLWETLHGVRPFKGDTPVALAATMMDDMVPTVPAGTAVPAWLRRVIARGLAKEPTDRFATMDDLLAALADDPARARRRWLALAAVGVVAAGIFGANAWQHRQALAGCRDRASEIAEVWNDDQRAAVRTAILAPQLASGASTWARVEPRLDAYAQRWSELRERGCVATVRGTRAPDLAARGDECLRERHDDLASVIDVLVAVERNTVHATVPLVDALAPLEPCDDDGWLARRRGRGEDIEQRSEVADLRRELAHARAILAGGDARAALAWAEPVLVRADSLGGAPLRIDAMLVVARCAESSADAGRAVALYEGAFELAVETGDDEDATEALASLVAVNANALGRPEQAEVWARVATAFLTRSDVEEGLPTANVLIERGALHRVRGDYPAAEADFARALAIRERVLGPENLQTLVALGNVAVSQFDRSDYDAATATLEQVIAGRTRVLGPDHPQVARALMTLAAAKGVEQKYDEGIALLQRALAIEEQVSGVDSPGLVQTLHNLGTMHDYAGDYDAAIAAHRRELAICERGVPPDPLLLGRALAGLGSSLVGRGDANEALPYLECALATLEPVVGPEHPDVALCLEALGHAHDARGEHELALTLRRRVLAIREAAYGPDHHDTGTALSDLGETQLLIGDTDAALDSLRGAILINLRSGGPEDRDVAKALFRIGRALQRRGDLDQALALLESSQVLEQRALGPDRPVGARWPLAIAEVLRAQGRPAEALRRLEATLASEQARLGVEHPDLAEILVELATTERALGHMASAELYARRGVRIGVRAAAPRAPERLAAKPLRCPPGS